MLKIEIKNNDGDNIDHLNKYIIHVSTSYLHNEMR